jgi:hypothetical protein
VRAAAEKRSLTFVQIKRRKFAGTVEQTEAHLRSQLASIMQNRRNGGVKIVDTDGREWIPSIQVTLYRMPKGYRTKRAAL